MRNTISVVLSRWRQAYRLRLKRKNYLWRAFRARRKLRLVQDNRSAIGPSDVILFAVLRNEALRLPYFLEHYRALGVGHFIFVDNDSADGSLAILDADDVTVWSTHDSYRRSRFGVDWMNWLLRKYGSGHWCVCADIDELLVYPSCDTRSLAELGDWLDQAGRPAYGALMLDMFPKGSVADQSYDGGDPTQTLRWFDAGVFRAVRQKPMQNLWLQGGTRDRVFFADTPARAPTLNKLPFIKWHRSYAFVNSTHSALPARLNWSYGGPMGDTAGGALLHSKFLPDISDKSSEERHRAEHFTHPDRFNDYYDALERSPDLWHPGAIEYTGWKQLGDLGIFAPGTWKQ